jgi:hypothetical protein
VQFIKALKVSVGINGVGETSAATAVLVETRCKRKLEVLRPIARCCFQFKRRQTWTCPSIDVNGSKATRQT